MMYSMRGSGQGNVQTISQNLDFLPTEDFKVRILYPPPAFDEKGNAKKYTAKELKELKGNGNLPGYAAEMDALKSGQIVTVYLAKAAPAPKPKGKKEKDKDELADDKPLIKMIVIQREPPAAPGG
jgi:hypothetical protein